MQAAWRLCAGRQANALGFFTATGVKQRTGWAPWTGVATRTTFATSAATPQNVTEAVKAIVHDLHAAAGYGLLAT